MNQALAITNRSSKQLMLALAAMAAVLALAQWAQAKRLVSDHQVQHLNTPAGASETLKSSKTTESGTTVSQSTTKTGNGINDVHSDVDVSADGSSVTVTNSSHQSAHSGDVESSSGNATSGSESSHSTSSTSVHINL